MADERDPHFSERVSQRYRELGTEEPPRHLDEAILAASRREAETRPAPLVPPTGRRHWYYPLAAAAVIVLSVAVTWHMQLERPDPGDVAQAPVHEPSAEAAKESKAADEQARPSAPASPPAIERSMPEARDRADAVLRSPERAKNETQAQEAPPKVGAMGGRKSEPARAMAQIEPPEKWLERIAELRKQGRHEEADKQLEAFRKQYPDYKLPENVLKK